MALNSSGAISLAGSTSGQSIALELGKSTTGQISLNDADVRTLAGKASGSVIMPTDFWGKSNIPPTVSYIGTFNDNSNLLSYTFAPINSTSVVGSRYLVAYAGMVDFGTTFGLDASISGLSNSSGFIKNQATILAQSVQYFASIDKYLISGIFATTTVVSGATDDWLRVRFFNAMRSCRIGYYKLSDSQNLTRNSYIGAFSESATSGTITTSAPSPSTIVAIVQDSRGSQNHIWTNITENLDDATRSGSERVSTASINLTSTGSYSFSVTPNNNTFEHNAYAAVRIYG